MVYGLDRSVDGVIEDPRGAYIGGVSACEVLAGVGDDLGFAHSGQQF